MMRARSEMNRMHSSNSWNKLRNRNHDEGFMNMSKDKVSHAYLIPQDSFQIFNKALYNNSIFRKLATVHKGTEGDHLRRGHCG